MTAQIIPLGVGVGDVRQAQPLGVSKCWHDWSAIQAQTANLGICLVGLDQSVLWTVSSLVLFLWDLIMKAELYSRERRF